MKNDKLPVELFEYDFDPNKQPSEDEVLEMMFVTDTSPEEIVDPKERAAYVKWIAENGERVTKEYAE